MFCLTYLRSVPCLWALVTKVFGIQIGIGIGIGIRSGSGSAFVKSFGTVVFLFTLSRVDANSFLSLLALFTTRLSTRRRRGSPGSAIMVGRLRKGKRSCLLFSKIRSFVVVCGTLAHLSSFPSSKTLLFSSWFDVFVIVFELIYVCVDISFAV